jgi:hypothetical protein
MHRAEQAGQKNFGAGGFVDGQQGKSAHQSRAEAERLMSLGLCAAFKSIHHYNATAFPTTGSALLPGNRGFCTGNGVIFCILVDCFTILIMKLLKILVFQDIADDF